MTTLTEADVEQIALEWLNTIGWTVTHGPDIAPDASTHERSGYTTRSFWNGGCTTRWLRAIPTCLTRPSTTHSASSPTRQAPRWKPATAPSIACS